MMPTYFYSFTPEQFESWRTRGTVWERGYLDSDSYFECGQSHETTFNRTNSPVPHHMFQHLKDNFRVHLKGRLLREGSTGAFYMITYPWKCLVEISNEEKEGLTPFEGKLPEYFYRRKIGLFGGPGSGKTCLARALSNHLSINMGINADNPYEFATTFISRYGAPTFHDEVWMILKQWAREEDISTTKQVMITDCPHPISFPYAKLMAAASGLGTHRTLPWLYEMALKGMKSFGSKVFLPFREEYVTEDGIRLHNSSESKEISGMICTFLEEVGEPYLVHNGSVEDLVRKIFILNSSCPN